jgi:hypothetical protein
MPSLLAGVVLLFGIGCETGSTDARKPMDEPLSAQDAMQSDAAMRQRADELMKDRRPSPPLAEPGKGR